MSIVENIETLEAAINDLLGTSSDSEGIVFLESSDFPPIEYDQEHKLTPFADVFLRGYAPETAECAIPPGKYRIAEIEGLIFGQGKEKNVVVEVYIVPDGVTKTDFITLKELSAGQTMCRIGGNELAPDSLAMQIGVINPDGSIVNENTVTPDVLPLDYSSK